MTSDCPHDRNAEPRTYDYLQLLEAVVTIVAALVAIAVRLGWLP